MKANRNDEHLEDVLGRLDFLIQHGQLPRSSTSPTPASGEIIPILTEVYETNADLTDGDVLPIPPTEFFPTATDSIALTDKKLEQAIVEAMPNILEALKKSLLIEMKPAINQALDELLPKIESIIRQQLKENLSLESGASRDKDQTET